MSDVDPYVVPIPAFFLDHPDAEVRAWFTYDNRFKHDLWQRSGGGDDAIADLQTQVSANDTDIAALDVRVSQNEVDVASIQSDVGDIFNLIPAQVTSVQTIISSMQVNVDDLNGKVQEKDPRVSLLLSLVSELTKRVEDLEQQI